MQAAAVLARIAEHIAKALRGRNTTAVVIPAAVAHPTKNLIGFLEEDLQQRLAGLDLVALRATEVWRDSLADRDFAPAEPPELALDQARVWGRIKVAMIEGEEDDEWGDEEDGDDLGGWAEEAGGDAGPRQMTANDRIRLIDRRKLTLRGGPEQGLFSICQTNVLW